MPAYPKLVQISRITSNVDKFERVPFKACLTSRSKTSNNLPEGYHSQEVSPPLKLGEKTRTMNPALGRPCLGQLLF
jgi:hypothetical protein